MTASETARFTFQPNGDVTVELSAAATAEEEALAVAIAEEFCAAANGIGDEEDEDDFAGFMRQRVAEPPRPPRRARPEPDGARQMLFLDHLDECQSQQLFWE
jgi:hypothetical protein